MFFVAVSILGSEVFVLVALVFAFLYNKRFGLRATITTLATIYVTCLLKMALKMPRPDPSTWKVPAGGYGMPSAHASISASFWGYLALYNSDRPQLGIASAVITFLVGLSRVYLGVHSWADVIVGWIIGLVFALAACMWADDIEMMLEDYGMPAKIAFSLALYILMLALAKALEEGDTYDFLACVKVSSTLFGLLVMLSLAPNIYWGMPDGEGMSSLIIRGLVGMGLSLPLFIIGRMAEKWPVIALAFILIGEILVFVAPAVIRKLKI